MDHMPRLDIIFGGLLFVLIVFAIGGAVGSSIVEWGCR